MARTFIAAVAAVPCIILLLPVAAAAGVLLAFVSAVRALGRLLEPAFVPWTALIEFDRALGWRPRPNLDAHYLADRDDVHRIVTDAEGWPGRRSLDESDVVVIGDSFVFGYGIDTDRSFSELNASLPVKAVGAPGYSMVHGVLLIEQLAERLRGKLVVWFAYLENDLQDNLAPEMRRYRAPFARYSAPHGGWEIADQHVGRDAWLCSDLDRRRLFARFCVPGPLADRAYSAAEYLVARAQAACSRVAAQLVIVTIPTPAQLTDVGRQRLAAASGSPRACDAALPDRRIAEACQRHGVGFVAGAHHLTDRDYKAREGIHWNERGHARMAKVLADVYESFRTGTLRKYRPQPDEAAAGAVQMQQAAALAGEGTG
jgi:hypothetical protein